MNSSYTFSDCGWSDSENSTKGRVQKNKKKIGEFSTKDRTPLTHPLSEKKTKTKNVLYVMKRILYDRYG